MGDMLQYVFQVMASVGVALYLSWQLSLVCMSLAVLIAMAGNFMITAVAEAQVRSLGV
jgi:hypothetical protein